MATISFEPIEWTQEIRDYSSINVVGRYLKATCRAAHPRHVLLDNKIDLHDRVIELSILDGRPEEPEWLPAEPPEKWSKRKILGWLHYPGDYGFGNGIFYLQNSEWFTAVWDQVRDGGYSDCRITVDAEPVELPLGSRPVVIWNSKDILFIDSVELQFRRKTAKVRTGLFGRRLAR
jgi:hypothetical protein